MDLSTSKFCSTVVHKRGLKKRFDEPIVVHMLFICVGTGQDFVFGVSVGFGWAAIGSPRRRGFVRRVRGRDPRTSREL